MENIGHAIQGVFKGVFGGIGNAFEAGFNKIKSFFTESKETVEKEVGNAAKVVEAISNYGKSENKNESTKNLTGLETKQAIQQDIKDEPSLNSKKALFNGKGLEPLNSISGKAYSGRSIDLPDSIKDVMVEDDAIKSVKGKAHLAKDKDFVIKTEQAARETPEAPNAKIKNKNSSMNETTMTNTQAEYFLNGTSQSVANAYLKGSIVQDGNIMTFKEKPVQGEYLYNHASVGYDIRSRSVIAVDCSEYAGRFVDENLAAMKKSRPEDFANVKTGNFQSMSAANLSDYMLKAYAKEGMKPLTGLENILNKAEPGMLVFSDSTRASGHVGVVLRNEKGQLVVSHASNQARDIVVEPLNTYLHKHNNDLRAGFMHPGVVRDIENKYANGENLPSKFKDVQLGTREINFNKELNEIATFAIRQNSVFERYSQNLHEKYLSLNKNNPVVAAMTDELQGMVYKEQHTAENTTSYKSKEISVEAKPTTAPQRDAGVELATATR